MALEFKKKKKSNDETKYSTFYSIIKPGTVINESDIHVFESVCIIISNIQKSSRKGAGWINGSVMDQTF